MVFNCDILITNTHTHTEDLVTVIRKRKKIHNNERKSNPKTPSY